MMIRVTLHLKLGNYKLIHNFGLTEINQKV